MAAVSTWHRARQTSHNLCLMIRVGFFGAKPQNHASWNQLGGARILWSLHVSSFLHLQLCLITGFLPEVWITLPFGSRTDLQLCLITVFLPFEASTALFLPFLSMTHLLESDNDLDLL